MNSTLTALLLGSWMISAAVGTNRSDDATWKSRHQEAVNRQRRIIFNNDGNEPVYYTKTATAEGLLEPRTSPLAGSQVDSIFYCTWSSGFGLFTHHTRVGQLFNTREAMFEPNRTQEFLDKGIDPLAVMVDFAHKNRMELFWSFRVNDTHDGSRAEYGPVMFRANRLKQEHPEWLIGSQENPPKFGVWSAVDFGVQEIRDLAFRFCEEVCTNYDVDGIELDFFRHAFFFKCSGRCEACGQTELDQMTELLQRVRKMTEARGRSRNRPILLAVRVPDSVEYCRFIGLDLERWLADGLVDLLIPSGYTQLNDWNYSVELGRRYGVKVYPSLDEPRTRDLEARKLRGTPATYRGRALNVWAAGADGVYMFNFFDPHSPLWRELGDPAALRQLDRNYFVSVRGPGYVPVPHKAFLKVPTLNPNNPATLAPGKPFSVTFQAGEDPADADERSRIVLRLQFKEPPEPTQIRTVLNGKELLTGQIRTTNTADGSNNWLEFPLTADALRQGPNAVELTYAAKQAPALSLLDLYVEITRQ